LDLVISGLHFLLHGLPNCCCRRGFGRRHARRTVAIILSLFGLAKATEWLCADVSPGDWPLRVDETPPAIC
jgi:hypothetical protein